MGRPMHFMGQVYNGCQCNFTTSDTYRRQIIRSSRFACVLRPSCANLRKFVDYNTSSCAYSHTKRHVSAHFLTYKDMSLRYIQHLTQFWDVCKVSIVKWTLCKHLKTVLFTDSWGRGALVTFWFCCAVYKCSYLLTYSIFNPIHPHVSAAAVELVGLYLVCCVCRGEQTTVSHMWKALSTSPPCTSKPSYPSILRKKSVSVPVHSRNNCVQNVHTFVHTDVYVALIHINVYKKMCTKRVHINVYFLYTFLWKCYIFYGADNMHCIYAVHIICHLLRLLAYGINCLFAAEPFLTFTFFYAFDYDAD